MTEIEIHNTIKGMISVYPILQLQNFDELERFLISKKEVLRSFTIIPPDIIECNFIYDFCCTLNMLHICSTFNKSPAVILMLNNDKAKYVLQICDIINEPKNFNRFISDNTFFQLNLYNLSETQLIKLIDILIQIQQLNGEIKQHRDDYINILISFKDVIKTTILLRLDATNIDKMLSSSELFVTHYRSYVMMEKLKG